MKIILIWIQLIIVWIIYFKYNSNIKKYLINLKMLKLLKKNKKIVIVILVLLLCVYLYKEHINKKNVENFNNHVSELMFFSAEWCGHCQDFKPVW